MTREEMSKAIEQHARLTAQVAQSIAAKTGYLAENILDAIRVEARQIVMRHRRRNGSTPPSDDGTPNTEERPPPETWGPQGETPKRANPHPHTSETQ